MTTDALFLSGLHEVEQGWIDYNGHMNMGYYTVLFDRCADEAYEAMGFGPAYIEATGFTTYTAEFHIRYLRELKLGDQVRCSFRMVDFDEKRFHFFQEMIHADGWVAATGESLALHVDTRGPKVAPMPEARVKAVEAMYARTSDFPLREDLGRSIGIRRKT
ncbi:thioesterase family protein [Roseovarius aestuariivivens]|uniref:thioesterase family protein n=1 Tax=Roseovarius aestuariivivens TaxID=1888910 RepID=UPI0010807CE6|nr:thioesterase family protein [Roseovarius aestuariivivens]